VPDDDHSRSEVGLSDPAGAGQRGEVTPGTDQPGGPSSSPALRKRVRLQVERLIKAIREGDEHAVEAAVIQLSQTRRFLAPLAFIVGAFVMLFSGLKLLFSNLRLALVQLLPAMWIWVVMLDWKVHVLHGKEYRAIRGPVVLLILAGVVLITAASFYLNAVFAYAIASPGSPDIRAGFTQTRAKARIVLGWGAGVGVAVGVATVLAPRWGPPWFGLLVGTVIAVMMVCYTAVPGRLIGVTKGPVSSRDKLAASAVGGAVGAAVCAPPYLLGRLGVVLLGSVFPLGVTLLVIGIILYAGAEGVVKSVKVSSKLLVKVPKAADAQDQTSEATVGGAEE
jgi:hypothetical protein